jgi:hypothetical protein
MVCKETYITLSEPLCLKSLFLWICRFRRTVHYGKIIFEPTHCPNEGFLRGTSVLTERKISLENQCVDRTKDFFGK